MRRLRYPEMAGHVALHDGVIADMLRVRGILKSGLPVHRRQAEQMHEWLAHHASEADRNLVVQLMRRPSAH